MITIKKGNIFDAPTVAGLAEAGREAIVPLEGRYMRPFASTIAEEIRVNPYFDL